MRFLTAGARQNSIDDIRALPHREVISAKCCMVGVDTRDIIEVKAAPVIRGRPPWLSDIPATVHREVRVGGYNQAAVIAFASNCYDNFSKLFVRFHKRMRFGDLFERKGPGDNRPKGTRGQSVKNESFGCAQSRRIADDFVNYIATQGQVLAQHREQRERGWFGAQPSIFDKNAAG